MTKRHDHNAQGTFSKKDHKIVLRKRLEKARKAVQGVDSKQLINDSDVVSKDERQRTEFVKKNKPNPFTHAQQGATHYNTQRQLLLDRMQQERLEREKVIKEKRGRREREKRMHLSRTRKGQPRLGGMLEGLLGRIEKQMRQ